MTRKLLIRILFLLLVGALHPEAVPKSDAAGKSTEFKDRWFLGAGGLVSFVYDQAFEISTVSTARLQGASLWFLWQFRPEFIFQVEAAWADMENLRINSIDLPFLDQDFWMLKTLLLTPVWQSGPQQLDLGGGLMAFYAGERTSRGMPEKGSTYLDIYLEGEILYRYSFHDRVQGFTAFSLAANITPGASSLAGIHRQLTVQPMFRLGVMVGF